MVHIIPSAIKTTPPASSNDWSGIVISEYRSCFDENGFGDWLVASPAPGFESQRRDVNAKLIELNLLERLPDNHWERQRADLYIVNPTCSDAVYSINIIGIVETANIGSDQLVGAINGNPINFGSYTLTRLDGAVHTFPLNTFALTSQFGDNIVRTLGANVSGPSIDFTVPPGPCPTNVTFHADSINGQNNDTLIGNIFYRITITKQ